MRTPKILLRIAAILMLIHSVGHTIGQSGWTKTTDPVQQEVIRQMTGPKFMFMGVQRSMGNYFDGYGNALTISLLVFLISLWLVSGELAANPLAKKLSLFLSIALLAWAADEFIYIFPFAACTTLLAAICTFAGWLVAVCAK
ncbi:hypothetical protein BH09BAC6_BH09BAC6_12510 [soil metagenome]